MKRRLIIHYPFGHWCKAEKKLINWIFLYSEMLQNTKYLQLFRIAIFFYFVIFHSTLFNWDTATNHGIEQTKG